MAQMNEKELNRALRTGLPSGVFLLYGSDRYLVERYASLIVDRAVKGDKTFNYERVDGARIDFDHLYDSILTLPMMAERRAVILDDPDIDKLSAGDLDKLLQILNDAVEPTVFIIAIKQDEFLPQEVQPLPQVAGGSGPSGHCGRAGGAQCGGSGSLCDEALRCGRLYHFP